MIVWINGTFGVGKTTTGKLVSESAGWRMFDPEQVGFMLADNLRDLTFDDFQDLPPWRNLVPVVASEIFLHTATSTMVAVQSVLVEGYWAELLTGFEALDLPVFHVVLDCHEDELRQRIETDEGEPQAKTWRLEHIAAFQAARPWLTEAADLVVDTTSLTPTEVAALIVDAARVWGQNPKRAQSTMREFEN